MKTLHLAIIVGTGIGVIVIVTLMLFFTTTNVSSLHPMTYLKNDTGVVTLGNQVYYFETPNYSHDAYFNSPQISFHDVIFTLFPSGFRGGLPTNGCGGQYYWTDAKFSDGTSELLHIFVGSPQCSDSQPPTYFSTHTNPQAGLTFYDGKMKLLVNITNITNAANQTSFSQVIPSGPIRTIQNNLRIVDDKGQLLSEVKVGQQVQITDTVQPEWDASKFVYILQILDKDRMMTSLSWLEGSQEQDKSINFSQTWTPSASGNYTINRFVWQNLTNPNSLLPPVTKVIEVK